MREFTEQELVRRKKLENIKNPYPERYETNYSIKDASMLEDGTTNVSVAGRIVLMRKMGKMSFLTIGDIEGKIQISVKIDMIGEEAYQDFKENFDLGDFIGVVGEVFTTHTGEKTIRADKIEFLGKALKPLPEKFHGLEDIETIYRNRYIDLITNDESKNSILIGFSSFNGKISRINPLTPNSPGFVTNVSFSYPISYKLSTIFFKFISVPIFNFIILFLKSLILGNFFK